jgi:hypothetical protein
MLPREAACSFFKNLQLLRVFCINSGFDKEAIRLLIQTAIPLSFYEALSNNFEEKR